MAQYPLVKYDPTPNYQLSSSIIYLGQEQSYRIEILDPLVPLVPRIEFQCLTHFMMANRGEKIFVHEDFFTKFSHLYDPQRSAIRVCLNKHFGHTTYKNLFKIFPKKKETKPISAPHFEESEL